MPPSLTPFVALTALFCLVHPAHACGPWFPNQLLTNGGLGLLIAPLADFTREIKAMELLPTPHTAQPPVRDHATQTAEADLLDLRAALTRAQHPQPELEALLARHQRERDTLRAHAEQWQVWYDTTANWPAGSPNPPPPLPPTTTRITPGLPPEFADYHQAAIHWHNGRTNQARILWHSLLNRPPAERHYRSTWAAFMLGKATWESDPNRAAKYFRQVRDLAQTGFSDTLGLAASSLGWEARLELRRGNYPRAIELYLEQAASGDPSAFPSLRVAASLALRESPRRLRQLAGHPHSQRVITAHLISGGWNESLIDTCNPAREAFLQLLSRYAFTAPQAVTRHRYQAPAQRWLAAVETANVRDVDAAEKLALASYQAGELDLTRRWLERAPNAPIAQWLKAKLLLREASVEPAAAILAQLSRQFPTHTPAPTPYPPAPTLAHRLTVPGLRPEPVPASRQILGELGALRLARSEYTDALDCLLRSGYWLDAAYVADRVLTLEELKAYVDRHWPSDTLTDTTPAAAHDPPDRRHARPQILNSEIRHLLGTRLIRDRQYILARSYLHPSTQPVLDQFLEATRLARDPSLPPSQRAAFLWQSAQTVFLSGLSLFTAPTGTSWRLVSGEFTYTNTPPPRLLPAPSTHLPVSPDEEQRVQQTSVYPDRSWYYRFIAADLAWEAARLMPDQTDETARVLWQAGSWIKYADPQSADRFYKALVQRCSHTPLGQEADRRRWFPPAQITPDPPTPPIPAQPPLDSSKPGATT
jgi:hypothetical protein